MESFVLRRLRPLQLLVALTACGGASTATEPTGPVDSGHRVTAVRPAEADAGKRPLDAGHDVAPDPTYKPAPPVLQPAAPPHDVGPYPIVLMHGMAGFNTLANLPVTISYFNGVQSDLEAQGYGPVFVTLAPPYATSDVRAAALAPQLEMILQETGATKLNLVGHSQGGLDARVLVSAAGLNLADRVASVTTIATPHHGTKVADLAMGLVSGPTGPASAGVANAFLELLQAGIYTVDASANIAAQGTELTTSYMEDTFNPKYVDAPGVVYASYAGRTNLENGDGVCDGAVYPNQPSALDVPQAPFGVTATYLQAEGETSDGLVAVTSAEWGTFMECVPADHLKECGMIDQNGADPISGFDHLLFFRAVAARLRAEGF
jgi:triacylglycerol lipase